MTTKKMVGIEQQNITVIMQSTSTYHLKVERFFRENTNHEIIILNPMISKSHKRNLRKTKTGKEDCLNLFDIFFKGEYNCQVYHDEIYAEMQFLFLQVQHPQEGATRTRNGLRQLLSMLNPAYFDAFRNDFMYSEARLRFIAAWPHWDLLNAATVEDIAKSPVSTHQRNPGHYRRKAESLKLFAANCYPAVNKDSVITDSLAETARRLLAQQQEIEILKSRLVALGRSAHLYDLFISVPGIGPHLMSSLIAELKIIHRLHSFHHIGCCQKNEPADVAVALL